MVAKFLASLYRCSIGSAATAFLFASFTLVLSGTPVHFGPSGAAVQMMLFAAPALLYAVGYSRGPKLKYFMLCFAGGAIVALLGLEFLVGLVGFDYQGNSSVGELWIRFGLWVFALGCLIPVLIGVWRRSEQDERPGGWAVPLLQWLLWTPVLFVGGVGAMPIWIGGIVGFWIEHRSVPGQRFAAVTVAVAVVLAAVAFALYWRPTNYYALEVSWLIVLLVPLLMLVPLTAWAVPRWRARFGTAGGA